MSYIKKQSVGLLCGALLFAGVAVTGAAETKETYNRFSDVSVDNEFFDEIDSMFYKRVITGYGSGGNYLNKIAFRPYENVTRAQASKMIAGISGYIGATQEKNNFSDIPESHWAHDHITHLAINNIVSGRGDRTFNPEGTLNRAQAAKMIAESFDLEIDTERNSSFSDVPENSWFEPYVNALTDAGITTGRTADTFDPYGKVTRYQLAAFLDRAYNQMSLEEMNLRQSLFPIIETNYRLESITGYHRQEAALAGLEPILPEFDTFKSDVTHYVTENYMPILKDRYENSCVDCSVELFELYLNPERFIEFKSKSNEVLEIETGTYTKNNVHITLQKNNGKWQLDEYYLGDETPPHFPSPDQAINNAEPVARTLMETFEAIKYEGQNDQEYIFKATGGQEVMMIYIGREYGEVRGEFVN